MKKEELRKVTYHPYGGNFERSKFPVGPIMYFHRWIIHNEDGREIAKALCEKEDGTMTLIIYSEITFKD